MRHPFLARQLSHLLGVFLESVHNIYTRGSPSSRKHNQAFISIMYAPITHSSLLLTALIIKSILATPLTHLKRDTPIPPEVSLYLGSSASISPIPLTDESAGYTLYRAPYTAPKQPARLDTFEVDVCISKIINQLRGQTGDFVGNVTGVGIQKPVQLTLTNASAEVTFPGRTANQGKGQIAIGALAHSSELFEGWLALKNLFESSLLVVAKDGDGRVVVNGTLGYNIGL